jgi:very-short-patch-repair endonuclease
MPHSAVGKQQRSRAKTLRQTMTRAETLLWRYLKAHYVDRLGFRRQVPMGLYVADFVCHARRIVVELDGETHDFEERLRRDHIRDAWLASRGYVVLRFTNEQVLSSLEGVVTVIRETADTRLRGAPPSLSLPRKGGGNPRTSTVQMAAKRASGIHQ